MSCLDYMAFWGDSVITDSLEKKVIFLGIMGLEIVRK